MTNLNTNEQKQKSDLVRPIIAIALDLSPILLFRLVPGFAIRSFLLLIAICLPVVGLIMGVTAFKQSRQTISKVLSVIAIGLPLAFVAFVLLLFAGVMTGLIPLM